MVTRERYGRLIRYLPEDLRQLAASADCGRAEELRLRAGQALSVLYPEGEQALPGRAVTAGDIEHLVMAAAKGSVYAAGESIKNGYITVEGGHRIGICGSAVVKSGEVSTLTRLTSASMRIAGERKGTADRVMGLYDGGFQSTLIVAPPGRGKTTLLRDMVRQLSDGCGARPPLRVGLVDERGEIAACTDGLPALDVGARTDVLTGCPKAEGMLMLIRTMNPQIVAVDEITAPEDVAAVETCRNCGAQLLATAHGDGAAELRGRKLYHDLLDTGVFQNIITISGPERRIKIERRDLGC